MLIAGKNVSFVSLLINLLFTISKQLCLSRKNDLTVLVGLIDRFRSSFKCLSNMF